MPHIAKPAPAGTRVIRTLHPGQPGTQGWLRMYASQLLCVRYRVDARDRTRYTTVELLVATAPMHHREHPATQVYAALDGPQHALLTNTPPLDAEWDEASQMWRMSLATARVLGSQHHAHTKRKRKRKGDAVPER